jgi:hypothetical protein
MYRATDVSQLYSTVLELNPRVKDQCAQETEGDAHSVEWHRNVGFSAMIDNFDSVRGFHYYHAE